MTITVKKIDKYRWEVPKTGSMRVPGMVYSTAAMLEGAPQKEPLKQVANVATLPGIIKASLAMPDMHWGYGFPIGGVAAFDWNSGIISPGGSATTSTVGSVSPPRPLWKRKYGRNSGHWWIRFFRIYLRGWDPPDG